eukprot:9597143-Karenia_brevis.AAC.1
MGRKTYDQKVDYLKQQMKESTIKAGQFRCFWGDHCNGTITKRGSYITRPDVIDFICHRIIAQHGGHSQETSRDRRRLYDCPYMWN